MSLYAACLVLREHPANPLDTLVLCLTHGIARPQDGDVLLSRADAVMLAEGSRMACHECGRTVVGQDTPITDEIVAAAVGVTPGTPEWDAQQLGASPSWQPRTAAVGSLTWAADRDLDRDPFFPERRR